MSYKRFLLLCSIGTLFAGTITGGLDTTSTVARNADEAVKALSHFWLSSYNAPIEKPSAVLTREVLAKAEPDECYNGIGKPYPEGPPCSQGLPKVNQAYVWGVAKSGNDLWFGTVANTHCLLIGEFLGITAAHEIGSWVCEFGASRYSPPLRESIGDWRPPRIFVYNTQDKTLTEKTPDDPLIRTTSGIRSAGVHGNVVILGGPGLSEAGAINLFAFNAETGEYLGSDHIPRFSNIRKWLVVNDVLYTAVANTSGGGSVLRWTGDTSHPFQADVVGNLDGDGLELTEHAGRLFVATWPYTALWMSPPIPPEGLTGEDADAWEKVWQSTDYEPDPVTAATYGGGAMASFDGYLYWGTMHVPFLSLVAHINHYGIPADTAEIVAAALGTYRTITIFRGRHFGTPEQEVDLLYGMSELPTFIPATGWEMMPNNMGADPLWGLSGFDNFFNCYTWTMAVYDDQLFVGTMDWSFLLQEELLDSLAGAFPGIPSDIPIELPPHSYGADLYRFPSSETKAIPESVDGVGNYANYGVRNMISDDALYLGMANPMNLMTDREDDLPEGGWELIKLASVDTACVVGDVNCDGQISPADALCTFWRSILGEWQSECACECSEQSADVNCDGGFTPGDALCIFWRSLLGYWQEECQCPAAKRSATPVASRIIVGAVSESPERTVSVPLLVENPRSLDAFRLRLVYPVDVLKFVRVSPGGATRGWAVLDGAEIGAGVVVVGGFHQEALSSEGIVSVAEVVFAIEDGAEGKLCLDIVEAADDLAGVAFNPSPVAMPTLPKEYTLAQNTPNPFNATTTIHYTIPSREQPEKSEGTDEGSQLSVLRTTVTVYNLLGQEVRTLVDAVEEPGYHSVMWDGRDRRGCEVTSGIYFYCLKANGFSAVKRMVFLK